MPRTIYPRLTAKGETAAEYMATKGWRERKKTALRKASNRCERCGEDWRTLYVHHKTYERFGNEIPEDLEVLCHNCHNIADVERRRSQDNTVKDFVGERIREVENAEIANTLLFEYFTGWAIARDKQYISHPLFTKRMRELGYAHHKLRYRDKLIWEGIEVIPDDNYYFNLMGQCIYRKGVPDA